MTMATTQLIASALSGLSILLLLVLVGVWIHNYRTFKSSLTLGLVAFAVVLLVENLLALYFFFSTSMLYSGDPVAQRALLVLRALQVCALGFLTYVTTK
jgi:hypothetical protein